jgi:tripartite-type tricarboxylate transporter receptor subunit TctC
VPYKGVAPALNDVLGGQVPLLFGSLPSTLPHIQASDLRSKLEASGVEMAGPADRPVAPAQMAALLREDIARWARIVKASGASLD